MNDTERWLPIPAELGPYEVSDMGNVRRGGELRRPYPTGRAGNKYMVVDLWCNNQKRRRKVHRLVCEAFIGPRPAGLVTRHLNGDFTDNRLENLAYGTYSENILDAVAHGTHAEAAKTHCKWGHEFTPENTFIDRVNHRQCRTCKRDRERGRIRKRPAATRLVKAAQS